MARSSRGDQLESGIVNVRLDTNGGGTQAVMFQVPFNAPPQVMIQRVRGDAGSNTAASVTVTGFTATVTGSDIISENLALAWHAMADR